VSKISELSDGGSLVSSDYLIAVRSGGNVKVRMDQINVDQVDLGDNEFIRLGNSQDLTMVHTSTQSIINQAGIGDLLIQKAGTTKTSITANGLEFPDNSKAIFGAGSDLQIYHDGSNSYVKDNGAGDLIIQAYDDIKFQQSTDNADLVTINTGGNVTIHGGNLDVTGTVTADDAGFYQSAGTSQLRVGASSSYNWNISRDNVSTGGLQIQSKDAAADVTRALFALNGDISFYEDTGTTPKFFWDASAESLGIGTSSPDAVIEANITTSGSGANNNTAGSSIGIGTSSTTQPILGMRWTGASHVGISGSAFSTQIVNDTANSNAFEMYTTGASPLVFGTAATERMRIDASGNVNIGVSSGAGTLTIASSGNTGLILRQNTASDRFKFFVGDGTGGYAVDENFISSNNTNLRFLAGGAGTTEVMQLTSSGNLLVNATSSSASSDEGSKLVSNGRLFQVSSYDANTQESLSMYSTGAAAYRFFVGWGGTVYATNNTISAISDQRLKENIRDLDVGLDAVLALKPRKFDWKEGKGKDIKDDRGFIAQEFEEIFPDLIDEWKDPAPEGEEPYKTVRQDLIPVLVKAIQEQQATIEALTARIAALES
jgi:hypothetical protein